MLDVGLLPSDGTGLPFPNHFLVLSKKRSVNLLAMQVFFLPVALLIFGEGGITWCYHQICAVVCNIIHTAGYRT